MLKLDLLGPTKDNFVALEQAFIENPIMNGQWKLFDLTSEPGTHSVSHGLGFKPWDVIVLHTSGGGTVAYHFAQFTDTKMTYTVSTAQTRIRFLIGKAKT